LFFLVIHFLNLDVDFTPQHCDFLVTNFLLPVEVVQDFFTFVELSLLFGVFLLLRLQLFIKLSYLCLKDVNLSILFRLLIFELHLHLFYNGYVRSYILAFRFDFYPSLLDYLSNIEFAVAKFANCAPELVQAAFFITERKRTFLFRTVFAGPHSAKRAKCHFFFILKDILARAALFFCI